jgi:dTDP-4-dehydrorhamnose 3,5-epimerase
VKDEILFDEVRLLTPEQHGDDRGVFTELYRAQFVPDLPVIQQVNYCSSRRGTIRGVHYDDRPDGQGKFVTCVSGAAWDVAVNLKTGRWGHKVLGPSENQVVYIPPGYGHGYQALTPDTVLVYFCTAAHDPGHDKAVNPLSKSLGITWPHLPFRMSDRDRTAPDWERPA